MPESFGCRLRQRREEQAIALATIAERTKIKLSLLEALERDDISHWPGGIFRRAFIRAYAHAIGLNADVVVRQFLELYPDPAEVEVTAPATPSGADETPTRGGPPTRLRYLVGSAIDSLSRRRQSPAPEEPVAAQVEAPAAAPAVLPPVTQATSEADPIEVTREIVAEPDFLAVARLCTEFGQAENTDDVQALLEKSIGILDAVGVIVWVWDNEAAELRPALAHGYSDKMLAQLPSVGRDADNVTAAAFRSGEVCAINGRRDVNGAIVAPLLTPAGCAGVLAIELPNGGEQVASVRAAVTIVAAQLSQLVGSGGPAEVRPQVEPILAVGRR